MEVKPAHRQMEVGVIPVDWDYQTFGHLYIEPSRNGIYKTSEYQGRGTRIVNMGEMFGLDFISDQDMSRVALTSRELSASGLQDGDLLFGRRSVVPSGAGKCSLVVTPSEPVTFESSIIRVRLDKTKAYPRFYYYFFTSPTGRSLVSTIVSGTNVKGIRATELRELKVPLPTRDEQEAVAEALSDADALIESLEQLIAKKRRLKQGAMQELLTGKRRLPGFSGEWGTEQLQSFVRRHNSGVYKKRELYGSGCNIVGVSDIYDIDCIDGQPFSFVPLSEGDRDKHTLNAFDLLYGESSLVREGIARTVYVSERGAGTSFAWHTRRYAVDQNSLISSFLYYYLQSPPARKYMIDNCIQTAITGINTSAYFACPILVPSVPEQRAIATVLSDIDAEIAALEAKLAKARQLKQGMMQELLTGRIRLI